MLMRARRFPVDSCIFVLCVLQLDPNGMWQSLLARPFTGQILGVVLLKIALIFWVYQNIYIAGNRCLTV